MINSVKLKRRFVRDNSIPVNIYDEPFFSEKLKTLKKYNQWEDFITEISKAFESEDDFLVYCDEVINNAINSIKNNEAYEEFLKEQSEDFIAFDVNRSKQDVYNKTNLDKKILSLDLKTANFTALKFFNKHLVENKESYEDFISLFTNITHIKKSKNIRQVIFGHLNVKKQAIIQRHLIGSFIPVVLSEILNKEEYEKELKKGANSSDLVLLNYMNDEISFDVSNISEDKVKKAIDKARDYSTLLNVDVGIEIYTLKEIKRIIKRKTKEEVQETKYYAKQFSNGDFQLKCVDAIAYPIVLKSINNEEITEYDKTFLSKGNIVRMVEDVKYFISKDE